MEESSKFLLEILERECLKAGPHSISEPTITISTTITVSTIKTTVSVISTQKADWELAIENMAAQNSQFQEETRNNQRNNSASIKNLEF